MKLVDLAHVKPFCIILTHAIEFFHNFLIARIKTHLLKNIFRRRKSNFTLLKNAGKHLPGFKLQYMIGTKAQPLHNLYAKQSPKLI